jgi:hypothetical protein
MYILLKDIGYQIMTCCCGFPPDTGPLLRAWLFRPEKNINF